MHKYKSLKQEWKVFKALAPKKLVRLIKKKKMSFTEYHRLIELLDLFGFEQLMNMFILKTTYVLTNEEKRTFDSGSFGELKTLFDNPHIDNQYIKMFTDNIQSESLKKFFYQKRENNLTEW